MLFYANAMLVSFRTKRERLNKFNYNFNTYKTNFSTAVVFKEVFILTNLISRAAKVITLSHAILIKVKVKQLKRLIL